MIAFVKALYPFSRSELVKHWLSEHPKVSHEFNFDTRERIKREKEFLTFLGLLGRLRAIRMLFEKVERFPGIV